MKEVISLWQIEMSAAARSLRISHSPLILVSYSFGIVHKRMEVDFGVEECISR